MGIFELMFLAAIVICLAPLAWRWLGSNENDVPGILRLRWSRRLLCGGLVGLAAFVASGGTVLALLAAILAIPGVIVGHGSYFPGGGRKTDNEIFQIITVRISDPMNERTKMLGMALTGLLVTVPISFVPGVSGFVALVGLGKVAAYWFPWALMIDQVEEDEKIKVTEWGERIWGVLLCGGVLLLA